MGTILPVSVGFKEILPDMVESGLMPAKPSLFGGYLMGLIEAQGLNPNSFSELVGENSGYVHQIRLGKRLSRHKWGPWCEALKLGKAEKQQFFDMAAIAYLPIDLQARFLALLEHASADHVHLAMLRSRVAELEAKYDERKR
jgi:hypothetical protein